ncbi:MAG: ATPase, T2SS/T4P/T4SS family [Vicinamibacterales bacterium]
MSHIDSLLETVVRMDGDVLVMHAGERPFTVGPAGRTELSSHAVALDRAGALLQRLLSPSARATLARTGAVEHFLPAPPGTDADHFTVMAATRPGDVWLELRRHRARPPVAAPAPRLDTPVESPFIRTVRIPVPSRSAASSPQASLGATRAPMPGHAHVLARARTAGASAVFVLAGQRPYLRVDGDLQPLDGERPLSGADIRALLLSLAAGDAEASRCAVDGGEWTADTTTGTVRCVAFHDAGGPGAVLHLALSAVTTATELGLSAEIRALAAEPGGLVLVGGPRGAGRSTLAAALVDLVNRARAAYVVTVERRITARHTAGRAVVSQRLLPDEPAVAAFGRALLAEDPDVLLVDDVASPALARLALDAASAGRLVFATVVCRDTVEGLSRLLALASETPGSDACRTLGSWFRGAVAQVLVRKSGGGRLAAREVLLGTPSVNALLAEGRTAALTPAIEAGRAGGMVPLNDALAAFVQGGVVDVRDAWRHAADREGLRAVLGARGIDTTFAGLAG